MLARIAQELFWLGRDLTRAEHTARMLDGAFHADVVGGASGVGAAQAGIALSWNGVLAVIGAKPPAPGAEAAEGVVAEAAGNAPPGVLGRHEIAPLLTLDTDSPASVVSCVYRARERARTLRDVISTEMWEALNSFYLSLGRYDLEAALATGPYSVYQEVKERCALFWGLLDKTMLRDEARSFLDAGGHIEEADMVLRMLRVATPLVDQDADPNQPPHDPSQPPQDPSQPPQDPIQPPPDHEGEALALLQAVGGFQAFRRHLRQAPTLASVGGFLLYESQYPGSVLASLEALRDALETADPMPRSAPPVLRLGRLIADLELHQRTARETEPFVEQLARVQGELEVIDREIDERYFAVAVPAAVHSIM
ncbi:MAG: alpha-E domain-containing protein [Acidobacteriota bacterium]|nr:alpha-E domain-containing protein [Acidobacteriota bacterium]